MEDTQRNDTNSNLLRNASIATAVCAFLVAFVEEVVHQVGYFNLRVVGKLLGGHGAALSEFIAAAIGAIFVFPLIHMALASIFKSQRNSRSRWKILLGWSVFLLILKLTRLI